jgi:hypothetical protein
MKRAHWLCAALLAAGVAAPQLLLGGWWYPALAAPGYALVAASAIVAGLLFFRVPGAPGAVCGALTLLFAAWCFWRQSVSPDPYVAREDAWLLLAALCVYLATAWQLAAPGPRRLVLIALFTLAVAQVVLAAAQFSADTPFHPLAALSRHMGLPDGTGEMPNHGWVTGTLASRTALSGVLEITTFLALGLLVWGRGGVAVKLLLLWVAAAGFAGLTLCLSRSAYLGVPVGLAVFGLVSFFVLNRGAVVHRGWLAAGALALIAAALVLALVLGGESIAVQLRLAILSLDEYRERLWFVTVPPMLDLDPWAGAGANMFDQLSLRYRGTGFTAKPVHAHNDWLQLLVEYGRVGLALGAAFFAAHLVSGWRRALRLAREIPPAGWLPQSSSLGLVTGSLAAFAAVGVHAVFDYSLHVPAVALLVALCAGWLASARDDAPPAPPPPWIRALALLPAVPGIILAVWLWREAPAERFAPAAENALLTGDPARARALALRGLALRPDNPRLLTLAGESAAALATAAPLPAVQNQWWQASARHFARVTALRPDFAYALREYALALDASGQPAAALPVHLRAIARDPDHARGYEYLALHYWRRGEPDQAARLFRLARTLTGSRIAADRLPQVEAEQQGR